MAIALLSTMGPHSTVMRRSFRGVVGVLWWAASVVLCLLTLTTGRDGAVDAACLVITPYVMDVTSTAAIIRWETDVPTSPRVCYRPADEDPNGKWSQVSSPPTSQFATMHSASISGLAPETSYEYKVLTGDVPGASDCELDESLIDCKAYASSSMQTESDSMPKAIDDPVMRIMETSFGGGPIRTSRDALPFRCRREYLTHRQETDDFNPEPFDQHEIDMIARLPEACNGEAPVPLPLIADEDKEDDDEEDLADEEEGHGNRKLLQQQARGCGGLTQSFKTSPEPGACNRRFRSWWLGDSGGATPQQTSNVDAAMAYMEGDWDATFAIGDNAYKSGTYSEYVNKFFPYFCQQLSHVALYPTLGNHDARASNGVSMTGPYFDFFVPGHPTESAKGSHYSYQNGRVHVVMLDLSYGTWSSDAALFSWLEDDLNEARLSGNTDWILVANHFPSYSKGSHDSDKEPRLVRIREQLVPIFEKHGVDVSVSGHSHAYERSHLIHGHHGHSSTFDSGAHVLQAGTGPGSVYSKRRCGDSGTVHVVTGSASKLGAKGSMDHPAMDVSLKVECTVVIHVEGAQLSSACIGPSGAVMDHFYIVKDMNPSPEGRCPPNRGFGPSCDSYPTPTRTQPPPMPTTISILSGLPVRTRHGAAKTADGLDFKWLAVSSPPSGWEAPEFEDSAWNIWRMPSNYGSDHAYLMSLPSDSEKGGGFYLFRRAFCLTRKQIDLIRSSESSLTLRITAAGDRGVVWLNGAELLRDEGTNHEMMYWNRRKLMPASAKGILQAGWNVLAVQMMNTGGPSDADFDGDLMRVAIAHDEEWPSQGGQDGCGIPAVPSSVPTSTTRTTSIISGNRISHDDDAAATMMTGLTFKWLSSVSSPPSGWEAPSFDDSAWPDGPMPAGYSSDHKWATALPSNSRRGGSYLFRRAFCLTQAQVDAIRTPEHLLRMNFAADNRGRVWLNGALLFDEHGRTNHEMEYWNLQMTLGAAEKGRLVVGANVVAAEVTNDRGSSDAGFDGDLRVTTTASVKWPEERCDPDPADEPMGTRPSTPAKHSDGYSPSGHN